GDGQLVSPLGRLGPTHARHRSHPHRVGRRACPAATPVSHGWVEGLHSGIASGRGRRVSSPASWARGAQAEASTRGAQNAVLRAGGQGPQQGRPGRGGEREGVARCPAPFWQAVAPPAARRDNPDSLYETVVWHLAGAGCAPTAPHALSILEPRSPSGKGLAHGQPLRLCYAAQEPAPG